MTNALWYVTSEALHKGLRFSAVEEETAPARERGSIKRPRQFRVLPETQTEDTVRLPVVA